MAQMIPKTVNMVFAVIIQCIASAPFRTGSKKASLVSQPDCGERCEGFRLPLACLP